MDYVIRPDTKSVVAVGRGANPEGKVLRYGLPSHLRQIWLGVHKDTGHTTLSWWDSPEKATARLKRGKLTDQYDVVAFRVEHSQDFSDLVHIQRLGGFTTENDPEVGRCEVIWKDAVLTASCCDLQVGTKLEQIVLDTITNVMYYYEAAGVLLLAKPIDVEREACLYSS